MLIKGLNHVNIVTTDLDGTAAFYERVLGLRAAPIPAQGMTFAGLWIYDADDNAVIHVQAFNPERHAAAATGRSTGPIDHVALNAYGFQGMISHCAALGIEVQVNDRKYGDLRQIFLTDPNQVRIELNFPDD